jgi:hypothetical protein
MNLHNLCLKPDLIFLPNGELDNLKMLYAPVMGVGPTSDFLMSLRELPFKLKFIDEGDLEFVKEYFAVWKSYHGQLTLEEVEVMIRQIESKSNEVKAENRPVDDKVELEFEVESVTIDSAILEADYDCEYLDPSLRERLKNRFDNY